MLRGEGRELKEQKRGNTTKKKKCSEPSEATVQLGKRKLALPHRAGATTGSTALAPWLLALVCVRKEGECRGGLAGAVDDGYGRVARGREVRSIWGYKVDVRLVRFGRRQVRNELRQLLVMLTWVRRSHRGLAESVWVVRNRGDGGLRTLGVRRSPLLRGGGSGRGRGAFARWGVRALVARGQGTGIREDDDRGAIVHGGRVGEVRLAEARSGREVHASAHDGGAEGKGEGTAGCARWRVKVCAVLETWAQGSSPRHSKRKGGTKKQICSVKVSSQVLGPTGALKKGVL